MTSLLDGQLSENAREERLQLAMGWHRRPRLLDSEEKRAVLLQLADLEKTARKDREFGDRLRKLLTAVIGGEL